MAVLTKSASYEALKRTNMCNCAQCLYQVQILANASSFLFGLNT